jgi:hypothetical protein
MSRSGTPGKTASTNPTRLGLEHAKDLSEVRLEVVPTRCGDFTESKLLVRKRQLFGNSFPGHDVAQSAFGGSPRDHIRHLRGQISDDL